MNDIINYILVGVSIIASGLCSWYFSRLYYLKSLDNQNNEYQKQISHLLESFPKNQDHGAEILKQQYIDNAVSAWKKRGTPEIYIKSISGLSPEEQYEIHRSASLRYKGREPKRNPYF